MVRESSQPRIERRAVHLAVMPHQGTSMPKDEHKAEYWARKYKDLPKAKLIEEDKKGREIKHGVIFNYQQSLP